MKGTLENHGRALPEKNPKITEHKMGIEKLKTADDRKARKPLLERKRRARINESLAELKAIVLQSLNKDSSRYTKMEKADILEMAVKHLKALRETVNGYPRRDSAACYREGFNQCASEVSRYVMAMDSIDHRTRSDILSHLNTTCQSLQMSIPPTPTLPPLSPLVPSPLTSDPTHDNQHFRYNPFAYPLPPFLPHGHARQNPTVSDITYLAQTPRYPPTVPCSSSTSTLTRETATTAKETPRPEPVWRPW